MWLIQQRVIANMITQAHDNVCSTVHNIIILSTNDINTKSNNDNKFSVPI